MHIKAFTDTIFAGSINDERSASGYCTFLGVNFVT